MSHGQRRLYAVEAWTPFCLALASPADHQLLCSACRYVIAHAQLVKKITTSEIWKIIQPLVYGEIMYTEYKVSNKAVLIRKETVSELLILSLRIKLSWMDCTMPTITQT